MCEHAIGFNKNTRRLGMISREINKT
jgi:hypothetical protein